MELRAKSAREPPDSGARALFRVSQGQPGSGQARRGPGEEAQVPLLPLPACTTLTVSKFTDVAEHPVVLYAT
jgi:hypothetical protein